MSCDLSQSSPFQNAAATAATADQSYAPAENPAGIVSHQNQFSEPDEAPALSPDRLFARAVPVSGAEVISEMMSEPPQSWAKPQAATGRYGTLFINRFHKITSGLRGGVEITAIDVFNREVHMLVREIQTSFVEEVRVSQLSEISMSMLLKDLFNFHPNRFKIDTEQYDMKAWYQFLNENVLPVAEELTEAWLGPKGRGIFNPIAELFYGPKGILFGSLHPESVFRKVRNLSGDMVVPLCRSYVGRATVVTYETDQAQML